MLLSLLVRRLVPLACAAALAGCGSAAGAPPTGAAGAAAPRGGEPFDFARPLAALEISAGGAAERIGAFAWEGDVAWTASRSGVVVARATERHRVRQLAGGDFEVSAEIDPGNGPAATAAKRIVYADGVTYARGQWAPYRARPLDRGEGARRQRDDSFRMSGDLARLYGPALQATAAGAATAAGRRARRFTLSLSGAAPTASPPPAGLPGGKYDADTQRHVDFLEGRRPIAAEGELILDDATGVPLAVELRGAFAQASDPLLRVDVSLSARVKALGAAVAAVVAPARALPDERKPKGVTRALEAAGFRKEARGERGGDEEAGPDEEP